MKQNRCSGVMQKNYLYDTDCGINQGNDNNHQLSSNSKHSSANTSASCRELELDLELKGGYEDEKSEENNFKQQKTELNLRTVWSYPPILAVYFTNFCGTYGFTTFGVNQPLFMRDLYNFKIEQVGKSS